MRRFVILISLAGFFLVSCASKPPDSSIDAQSDYADLSIDGRLSVTEVDGKKAEGRYAAGAFFKAWSNVARLVETHVQLPPGIHTFRVNYRSGNSYSPIPLKVWCDFESNKSYALLCTLSGSSWLELHFYEVMEDGEKVKIAPRRSP
jgi:hypothetical protein